jgi:hypothetical protein
MAGRFFIFPANSKFRLDPARAEEAPLADRFKNGEQSRRHKNNPQPEFVIHDDDARDEAQRADDPARETSVTVEVGFEKPAHGKNLPRRAQKPSVAIRFLILILILIETGREQIKIIDDD